MPAPFVRSASSDSVTHRADDTLVPRIVAGDAQAFETLFHAYYNALCIFAESYVHSAHLAEELVEDVFCWVWEHHAEWQVRDGVKAYLYSAVRNRALHQLARHRVAHRAHEQIDWEEQALGMSAPMLGAQAQIEVGEFAHAVERAVAVLPVRCRQAFDLHRRHEMTYAEIAAVMEVSVKTVENHLARAVKALRMSLAAWRPER